MTAVSDIQQPALETPVGKAIHRSRARVVRRLLLAFLLGLALSFAVAAAALVAWDLSYESRVLPGVHVGATDLSGLDRAGATAALEQAYSGYGEGRVLISTIAGDVAVDYGAFARRADIGPLVDTALRDRPRRECRRARPGRGPAGAERHGARTLRRVRRGGAAQRNRGGARSARGTPHRRRDRDGPARRTGVPRASGLDLRCPGRPVERSRARRERECPAGDPHPGRRGPGRA